MQTADACSCEVFEQINTYIRIESLLASRYNAVSIFGQLVERKTFNFDKRDVSALGSIDDALVIIPNGCRPARGLVLRHL